MFAKILEMSLGGYLPRSWCYRRQILCGLDGWSPSRIHESHFRGTDPCACGLHRFLIKPGMIIPGYAHYNASLPGRHFPIMLGGD